LLIGCGSVSLFGYRSLNLSCLGSLSDQKILVQSFSGGTRTITHVLCFHSTAPWLFLCIPYYVVREFAVNLCGITYPCSVPIVVASVDVSAHLYHIRPYPEMGTLVTDYSPLIWACRSGPVRFTLRAASTLCSSFRSSLWTVPLKPVVLS
jgi:hypothetical protein